MKVEGDKELTALLNQLPGKIHRKVSRKAVNAGSTPILRAIRSNTPVESGLLKKSLGKRSKTYNERGVILSIIGPRRNVSGVFNGKLRVPANYAHLVEDGFVRGDGEIISGNPFMRRGFEQSQTAALSAASAKFRAEIPVEAVKLGRSLGALKSHNK